MRTRVRLLVQLTTRHGRYRVGWSKRPRPSRQRRPQCLRTSKSTARRQSAARRAVWRHVLVDNPDLYERWRFPKVTRQRLSSHHRTVDKVTYPDLGMHGPLVREKLHGRTATGTWVQLEKTPAAFGASHRLPSWNDVHTADYVVTA